MVTKIRTAKLPGNCPRSASKKFSESFSDIY
nr:MAG TPA: hypothetical protein [Caudoviricetes sp.]